MRVLAKNAPLNAVAHELSVLTYNVLAPLYVRPLDARTGGVQQFAAFGWAEPAAERLDWAARQPRLSTELRSCAADVLMLQEVQFEKAADGTLELPQWLQEVARASGYEARIPPQRDLREIASRNERVLGTFCAVGNALLWRPSRLEAATAAGGKDATTRVGLALRGRRDGPLAPLGPTAFFSVHLDAKSEAQRVGQLEKCLEAARSFGTREVIIAGDLNTEALRGSAVATLLGVGEPTPDDLARECASALRLGDAEPSDDEGEGAAAGGGTGDGGGSGVPTEEQMASWSELHRTAATALATSRIALARVPSGATRAAFVPGQTSGPCGSWSLDHVLFSSRTLTPSARWATLEALPDDAAAGLPTVACPSDHLPLGAAFEIAPAPALDAAGRAAFLASLAALEAAQAAERAALATEQAAAQAAAEAAVVAAGGFEEEPPAAKGKKNKKKGGPPPKEMIEFLRGKREAERAQRLAHREQRAEFAAGCGDTQLDVLEEERGREWVEAGVK